MQLGTAPLVKTASKLVQTMIYQNKFLLAGMIVAGWDPAEGGQVYSIPLGGTRVRQPFAIGGSGSTYIYAHCDASYKEGMSKAEVVQLFIHLCLMLMSRLCSLW